MTDWGHLTDMAAQMLAVSVIVEWYNLNYAELDRATRMLVELVSQSEPLELVESVTGRRTAN